MAVELIELGRAKCRAGEIRRKGFTRKDGTRVKSTCVPDTGAKGKTPPSKRVLPKPKKGGLKCGPLDWDHKDSKGERMNVLKCLIRDRGKSCRSVIGDLNLLANFTKKTSPDTHRKARADMATLRKKPWCRLKTKK